MHEGYFSVRAFIMGFSVTPDGMDYLVLMTPVGYAHQPDINDFTVWVTDVIHKHVIVDIFVADNVFNRLSKDELHECRVELLEDAVVQFPDPMNGFITIDVGAIDTRDDETVYTRSVKNVPNDEATVAHADTLIKFRAYNELEHIDPQFLRITTYYTSQPFFDPN